VAAEPKHLLRTLALLWARLGPFRIYFVVLLAVVSALAALGLWHLIAPRKKIDPSATTPPTTAAARVSPGGIAPSSATPNASIAPQLPRAIAITEVPEAEERGPRGETYIVAKIGIAPRTTDDKDDVEIRVLFFDLDANNEMRPTNAQVTYQWIPPVRDWTDPEPKYLAATYLQRRPSRHSREQLRYGGFVVRIYCDGKLQDARSKPETLLASQRASVPPPALTSQSASPVATSPFRPQPFVAATPLPTRSPSPGETKTPDDDEAPLPKGIPIPGKPGFVQSPYDPKFIIDVRGFPPGTLVNDPNTNKPFRIP
jgi:hypothetical protein